MFSELFFLNFCCYYTMSYFVPVGRYMQKTIQKQRIKWKVFSFVASIVLETLIQRFNGWWEVLLVNVFFKWNFYYIFNDGRGVVRNLSTGGLTFFSF